MVSEWMINEWMFKMLCRKCPEVKRMVYRDGEVWAVYWRVRSKTKEWEGWEGNTGHCR